MTKPLKIGYIDDEPELLELFKEFFEDNGFEVIVFSDVEKGIEYFCRNSPDIMFLDYRMPGFLGEEVAQKLCLKVPVALITGDFSVDSKYPFAAVFEKPFQLGKMLDFVNKNTK